MKLCAVVTDSEWSYALSRNTCLISNRFALCVIGEYTEFTACFHHLSGMKWCLFTEYSKVPTILTKQRYRNQNWTYLRWLIRSSNGFFAKPGETKKFHASISFNYLRPQPSISKLIWHKFLMTLLFFIDNYNILNTKCKLALFHIVSCTVDKSTKVLVDLVGYRTSFCGHGCTVHTFFFREDPLFLYDLYSDF